MHRQIAADPVTRPVVVVEAGLPQRAPGEGIQMHAADALWKHQRGDGDVTLHHPRRPLPQVARRIAGTGPDCAGDVGRAVQVLSAGIDQVHLVWPDRAVRSGDDPIMDDCAVLAGARRWRGSFRHGTPPPGCAGRAGVPPPTVRSRRHRYPAKPSQCRNRHTATASRRCASRAPCCSTGFLHALGSAHGSGPATTTAPA